MTIETINKLCCPFDKQDLELSIISKDIQETIQEGILLCMHCKRVYPIVKGIPIMSPDEYRELSLEQPLLESWKQPLNGRTFAHFRLSESDNDRIIDKN